jgi:hypothetical protein
MVEAGDVEVREYFGGDGECLGKVVDFALEVSRDWWAREGEGGGRREREGEDGRLVPSNLNSWSRGRVTWQEEEEKRRGSRKGEAGGKRRKEGRYHMPPSGSVLPPGVSQMPLPDGGRLFCTLST